MKPFVYSICYIWSNMQYPTHPFVYKYLAGPVVTEDELKELPAEGNCRFALQLYFYQVHNCFYTRDEIYLPGGYKVLGKFVFKEEEINYGKLKEGDIIFAQNLRNKKDEEVLERDVTHFSDKDEWLFHFHSAIWVGNIPNEDEPMLWHATSIENGPVLWPLSKFLHYYKPISAKRVL